MDITKNPCKYIEVDYSEFEKRILGQLIPKHIPTVQWKKYLEGKNDRKEEKANQYSK